MMMFWPAPRSIHGAAEAIAAGMDATGATKELLDGVIWAIQAADGPWEGEKLPIPAEFWADEPPWVADPVRRVYFGALAEHLAALAGQAPPEWCLKPVYFAPKPITGGRPERWEALQASTPEAFRRRGLYCGPVATKLEGIRRLVLKQQGAVQPSGAQTG